MVQGGLGFWKLSWICFLRTATNAPTYARAYILVIFTGIHSTKKCPKWSNSMFYLFYFAKILKLTEIWSKTDFFGHIALFWLLKGLWKNVIFQEVILHKNFLGKTCDFANHILSICGNPKLKWPVKNWFFGHYSNLISSGSLKN